MSAGPNYALLTLARIVQGISRHSESSLNESRTLSLQYVSPEATWNGYNRLICRKEISCSCGHIVSMPQSSLLFRHSFCDISGNECFFAMPYACNAHIKALHRNTHFQKFHKRNDAKETRLWNRYNISTTDAEVFGCLVFGVRRVSSSAVICWMLCWEQSWRWRITRIFNPTVASCNAPWRARMYTMPQYVCTREQGSRERERKNESGCHHMHINIMPQHSVMCHCVKPFVSIEDIVRVDMYDMCHGVIVDSDDFASLYKSWPKCTSTL